MSTQADVLLLSSHIIVGVSGQGSAVGDEVGCGVGDPVGSNVGMDVGYEVGAGVGKPVGDVEGRYVGESVASAEQHSVFAAGLSTPCRQTAVNKKLQHCPG
jgi:hypothetical protein